MNGHSYRPSATRATSRKGKGMWDLPLLGPITTGSDYPETLLGSALHRVAAARSGTTKAPDSPLSTLCTSRTPCNVVAALVVLSTVVARSSSSDPPPLVQHEWLSSSRAVDKTRAARPYLHKG
ncbi:Os08g0148500 [Oryza sativa Japonica Group]|uniref:Os08g0148500 protein n=1 Tax=Oryza sativa subsp. japonica TaxID=39947 RepID=A0A0P0XC94_ORYSJ|nr:Os08g0148500 [Oryza sativa Japonica Group]